MRIFLTILSFSRYLFLIITLWVYVFFQPVFAHANYGEGAYSNCYYNDLDNPDCIQTSEDSDDDNQGPLLRLPRTGGEFGLFLAPIALIILLIIFFQLRNPTESR